MVALFVDDFSKRTIPQVDNFDLPIFFLLLSISPDNFIRTLFNGERIERVYQDLREASPLTMFADICKAIIDD